MNAKLCKRIRRSLNKARISKAEIVMVFTSPVMNPPRKSGIPMTFKYPLGSYQRIYRGIKNRKGR